MTTLTIRIPDDKAERLRQMARHRGISLNKLMEEFSTAGLSEFDAETRFRTRAARATPADGLTLLKILDVHFSGGKEEG